MTVDLLKFFEYVGYTAVVLLFTGAPLAYNEVQVRRHSRKERNELGWLLSLMWFAFWVTILAMFWGGRS